MGLFSGKAKIRGTTSFIFGKNWKIELPENFKWISKHLNKDVEIYGYIEPTQNQNLFKVNYAEPRLINLKDQLGETVHLRGMARSINGFWWFNYRGLDLYVENMKNLPNWSGDNHWRAMEISGILMKERKPDMDQILDKIDRDLKTYYIIKNAKWKPIKELLLPERISELTEK